MLAPRLTVYPEYVRDRRPVARPRRALRGAGARPTSKASRATTTWAAGGDDARRRSLLPPPSRRPRAPAARSARCSTACSPAKRSASTRSSRCSARVVPRSRAVAEVADQLRREIVGDAVTFVRNRNINYTNVCTFKCRFCAFSKGPLSLNLRGDPYLLDLEEMQRRVRRGGRVRRDRGVPAGRHPSRLRRRLLPRRRPGGEGGRARHPRARLHRARGHRRRAPARHAARATTSLRAQGRRPRDAARHRGRDPRRRGARDHLPRQGQHRGVARGAPHRALASACGRTSRSCSAHVERPDARRPPPRAHPRRCRRRPAASPSSCRCRSCTWPRRSSSSGKARHGPDVPRGAADARGRPHRVPRLDRQRPGVVGEDAASRGARQALQAGVQRPRRHADGREHLACRRREPRPGARRGGASARSSSRSAARSSSAPRSTAASTTVGPPPPSAARGGRSRSARDAWRRRRRRGSPA